jgi:hypothetical protein
LASDVTAILQATHPTPGSSQRGKPLKVLTLAVSQTRTQEWLQRVRGHPVIAHNKNFLRFKISGEATHSRFSQPFAVTDLRSFLELDCSQR